MEQSSYKKWKLNCSIVTVDCCSERYGGTVDWYSEGHGGTVDWYSVGVLVG